MNAESTTLIDEIKDRKVIPYFITYLGGIYAIIQLIEWYTGKNYYSPYWSQMVGLFLILLIPTVLVFLYKISKKDPNRFNNTFFGLVSVNFLLTIAVLFFSFKSKPLEATAEKVKLVNESGEEVEKIIPNIDFTKKLILFPFADTKGENASEYRLGIPTLASYDLGQNNRLSVIPPVVLKGRYDKYDEDINEDVPLSVQKQIAEDYYADYFANGTYTKQGDSLLITINIYTTQDGKQLFSKSIRGNDLFEITDALSTTFVDNLYTKDFEQSQFVNYTDLPASELITRDFDAFRKFMEATIASNFDNDYVNGQRLMSEAYSLDPKCVECAYELSSFKVANNDLAGGLQTLEEVLSRVQTLPERQQYRIKSFYYLRKNEMTKALALMDIWRKTHPNNEEPYSLLIAFYPMMGEMDKAIEIGEEAIANGHRGNFLLTLSNLYAQKGEFEEAEKTFGRFKEAFPSRALEATSLGNIYIQQGRFEEALKLYQDIELLKPNDVSIQLLIGRTYGRMGEFEKELRIFEQTMSKAKNRMDSVKVLEYLESHYERKGQLDKTFELISQRKALQATYLPPIAMAVEIIMENNGVKYIEAGKNEELLGLYQSLSNVFPDKSMTPLFDLNYAMLLQDPEIFNPSYEQSKDFIEEKSGTNQRKITDVFYYTLNGKYDEAIAIVEELFNETGMKPEELGVIPGQAYTGAKQFDKAIAFFENLLLKDPTRFDFLKELGDVYKAAGKEDKANEYYNKALKRLQDADENHRTRNELQQLLSVG